MNIFDLSGPEFLQLYLGLIGGGLAIAFVMRHALRGPATDVDVRSLDLQPFEIALLAEGDRHAVRTALASLAQRELIAVEANDRTIRAAGRLAIGASADQRLHSVFGPSPLKFEDVVSRASALCEQTRANLEQLGLLVNDNSRFRLRALPALVLGVVLAIGLYKIHIGNELGRPVGYLTVLCLLTGGAMVLLFVQVPRRSRAGDVVLSKLRSGNRGLRQTVEVKPARVEPGDLSLAVALYGFDVINSGPLVDLGRVTRPVPPTISAGDSSCSSGSSCSSSSCGGGCGGGGCGGCSS